jgi:hypothetical protein
LTLSLTLSLSLSATWTATATATIEQTLPTQLCEHCDDPFQEFAAALVCRWLDELQDQKRVQHGCAFHGRTTGYGVALSCVISSVATRGFGDVERD